MGLSRGEQGLQLRCVLQLTSNFQMTLRPEMRVVMVWSGSVGVAAGAEGKG